MAHVNMTRAQAVSIIERRNAGHEVPYLDWAVAGFVIGQHEQRRDQASRGSAGFYDQEMLGSGPELRGASRGNVGAQEADNSKAGAKLVAKLPGDVTDYYVDVLPDDVRGCGLYRVAGAEQRAAAGPGRMADPARPFTPTGRLSGRMQDMLRAHDARQKATLRSIAAANAAFWSKPENQGKP
jgi:hypothetical protein